MNKETEDLIEIHRLGAQGDGVGGAADKRFFVPGALPGEFWRRNGDGTFTCVTPLADRAPPLCRHFSVCGGCLVQHVPPKIYKTWKTGLVTQALNRHGIDLTPHDLISIGHGERRRCVLSAEKDRTGHVMLGYHRARSHDLVPIEECPVLTPQIVKILPGLTELLNHVLLPRQTARLTVLHCAEGIDADLSGITVKNDPAHRSKLAALAKNIGLVRLTNNGDTLVVHVAPTVLLGGISVPVPCATVFLQAVTPAEQVLCEFVRAATVKAKRVADLFCGLGTFTFSIARQARILAVDSEKDAISALEAGRDRAQGLKPIETLRRDLFRTPLSRKELEPFDAVVFDPPRAGAEAQTRMLAKSGVPVIVAISCNPGTLARDLAILIEGGYELEAVQPIDQFLYTEHVECVAVLRHRKNAVRRR